MTSVKYLKIFHINLFNVLHVGASISVQSPDHPLTGKCPMSSDHHHGSLMSFPGSLLLFPKWVMR